MMRRGSIGLLFVLALCAIAAPLPAMLRLSKTIVGFAFASFATLPGVIGAGPNTPTGFNPAQPAQSTTTTCETTTGDVPAILVRRPLQTL